VRFELIFFGQIFDPSTLFFWSLLQILAFFGWLVADIKCHSIHDLFHAFGFTALTAAAAAPAVLLISLLSAAVELLPAELADDNVSVPAAAWALSAWLLSAG